MVVTSSEFQLKQTNLNTMTRLVYCKQRGLLTSKTDGEIKYASKCQIRGNGEDV